MKQDFEKEERIFADLVLIEDRLQREVELARMCEGDADLGQRIGLLLASHETDGLLIDDTNYSSDLLGDLVPLMESAGQFIESFQLIEKIGEGGMGLVFKAQQTSPVQRTVALKVLRVGTSSKKIVERFENERQTLAVLDHPNITKILEGGITESGRPYFVMEYVDGCPITEYCNVNQLGARQRLGLFCDVCKAIQHAHLRGIIHRDIKPANVLVQLSNGTPIVKVIDFGIAKLIDHDFADTKYTIQGQLLGTPGYMSPEQADQGHFGDIDSRTDIYSLGALLYAMLTGVPPIEIPKASNQSILRTLETIRDSEPMPPSARILSRKGAELLPLHSEVKGDLDWVVMKAIQQDRNLRYESPISFARDVERHLAGAPVEAAGPNFWYQTKKRLRKYRTVVAVGLVGILFMLTAAIGGTLLAIKARDAESVATHARFQEQQMRETAELQRDRALKAEIELRQIVHVRQSELAQAETENELHRSKVMDEFFDQFFVGFSKDRKEKIDDTHFKYVPRFRFETVAFEQPILRLGKAQLTQLATSLFSVIADDFCEDDLRHNGQEIVDVDLSRIEGIHELMITALQIHQKKCETMFAENFLLNADAHECLALHLLAQERFLDAESHLNKASELRSLLQDENKTDSDRFNEIRNQVLIAFCQNGQQESPNFESQIETLGEKTKSLGGQHVRFLSVLSELSRSKVE